MAEMTRAEKIIDGLQTAALGALAWFGGRSHGSASTAAENGVEALKAGLFGFSHKDEALFWDAVTLGVEKNSITPDGVNNLREMFKLLTHFQRARLGQIVGIDEQEITTQTPARNADGTLAVDKKGGQLFVKESARGNMRGMRLVAMLSKMSPKDAAQFLKDSGTLDGPTDDIKVVWEQFKGFLNKPETKARYRATKAQIAVLIQAIDTRAEQVVLQYLGAANRADAERIVTAREQAAKALREQSSVGRNLRGHRGRQVFLVILILIVVAGAIHMAFWGGPTH